MKKSAKFNTFKKRFFFFMNIHKFIYFFFSYLRFLLFNTTSHFPQIRSVAYFSEGRILDLAHKLGVKVHKDRQELYLHHAPLLNLDHNDILEARNSLESRGFWISPKTIDVELLEEFHDAALKHILQPHGCNVSGESLLQVSKSWNRDMVNLDSQWVANQPLVLQLSTCPSVLRVAGEYLWATPVLNHLESWFSFPVEQISAGSAKNWHWDCDGIRWLKVFVYLTDVGLATGPHGFVSGSHRKWLVNDKSTRVSDEAIQASYPEDIKVFTAPKGTVIFEDTRGFHRGYPLESGYRLVLQIQFNVDSFGIGPNTVSLPQSFREKLSQSPKVLSYYNR